MVPPRLARGRVDVAARNSDAHQVRASLHSGLRGLVFPEPRDAPALLGEELVRLGFLDAVGCDLVASRVGRNQPQTNPVYEEWDAVLLETRSAPSRCWRGPRGDL